MRQIIGNRTGSPYDIRYCAFMGERLLTVFIITNNLKYKEYHIRYANKTINIGRKIARILHINKNSSFYIKLQKNTVQNLHIKDRKTCSRNYFNQS